MGPLPGAVLALGVPLLAAGAVPAPSACEIEAEGALSTKREVRFELEVELDASEAGPEGHVWYRDPTAGLHFRSTRIASLEIAGSKGTVRGSGEANGAATEFTIEVEDARPGGDPDRLRISLSTGYAAAGDVVGGKVEIECEDEEEGRISRPGAGGGGDGLLRELGRDFRHLGDRGNLLVLAAGGAASLALQDQDREITRAFERSHALDAILVAGDTGGDALVQGGVAIATYVVGSAAASSKVRLLGYDLIRAQLLNGILTLGLKQATGRSRPDGSNRRSFPSGHSSASFATATVLWRHYGWKAGLPGYLFAAYVAGSRLQDNKHFPSDVVFGAAVGIASGRSVTVGRGSVHVSVVPLAAPAGGPGFGVALVGRWR